MNYFIAIDGGGTKTDSILFDETGHIIQRDVSKGCNSLDIGAEPAKERLKDIFLKLYSASPDGTVCTAFCGVAGSFPYADDFQKEILQQVPLKSLRIQNDVGILISGMLGSADGCGMVCGTGSGLGVQIKGEMVAGIGGRGYLVDALGSGFAMAREALCKAFRAIDGRDAHTVLVDLFQQALGKPLQNALPDIYAGGRRYIASFAHLVFEGQAMGDRASCEIIENGALRLAELTWAAEKYFEGAFPVVMGGGIFAAYPHYAQMVKEKASSRANMICSNVPPVYGSAVEAMDAAGLVCDLSFRETFLKEYALLKATAART